MSRPRRRQVMQHDGGYQTYQQGYAGPTSPNFQSPPMGGAQFTQSNAMQSYTNQYSQAMMMDPTMQNMYANVTYYQQYPQQQHYMASPASFQQQQFYNQRGVHSGIVTPAGQPPMLQPPGDSSRFHSQSPATASSSVSARGTPPVNKQLEPSNLNAGHSPRPSAGKTRLQTFVFPKPTDDPEQGDTPTKESSAEQDNFKSDGTPDRDSSQAGSTSFPSKLSFTSNATEYAPFFPGVDMASMTGASPALQTPDQTTVYNARVPPFSMPRGNNTALRRPDVPSPFVPGGIPQQDLPGIFKSDIALGFPILPQLPALPSEPESADDKDVQAYKTYSASLKTIIEVYEKRDAHLRLRTEAVGFDPQRAWKAWEANKDDQEATQQEDVSDRQPILGVRLLQRVAKLSAENDELGKMLESKLDFGDWQKEKQELVKELRDSHALIEAMDEALSKAEARASAAEKALMVACDNNSTTIVPSTRGGRSKRGESDRTTGPSEPADTRQPQSGARRGRGGRLQ